LPQVPSRGIEWKKGVSLISTSYVSAGFVGKKGVSLISHRFPLQGHHGSGRQLELARSASTVGATT